MRKINELTVGNRFFIIDLDKKFSLANISTNYEKYPENVRTHTIKKVLIDGDYICFYDKMESNINSYILRVKITDADCSMKYQIEYVRWDFSKSFVIISDESLMEEQLKIIGLELMGDCDKRLEKFKNEMEKEKALIRFHYWEFLNNLSKKNS